MFLFDVNIKGGFILSLLLRIFILFQWGFPPFKGVLRVKDDRIRLISQGRI